MKAIEQTNTYWLEQLAEPPTPPRLPWDREPPPVSSFLRETVSTVLPVPAWTAVQSWSAQLRTTPQVVLLAALDTLLFRYSGQTDLIVGTFLTPGADPTRPQLVPLRTRLAGREQARDLVLAMAAAVYEARDHLDLPFPELLKAAGQEPGLPGQGLFNVALAFHGPDSRPPGSSPPADAASAEFLAGCALVLRARETSEGLALECEYDAELFDGATVERLARHFGNLLAAMAAEPRTTLERLTLLSAAELHQLLVDWNATGTAIPGGVCIHHLIEAQAKTSPNAVAVICRDQHLTYAELNARANQLASCLSRLGAGPDILVGLCVERSLEMLVGLLGILKSGSAYLPLDPAYPAERLAFMIRDAGVKVVVTQERLAAALPPAETTRVLLDAHWPAIASEPAETVDHGAAPHHLAYVIYTSGSTGTPKGVMVEHRNVINFFAGMDARIQRPPGSTWLAVTSPSFDISVLELFWTLARGLKVVLYAGDDPPARAGEPGPDAPPRPLDFSLFYFSSDQVQGPGGAYRLLLEGARFADDHGFAAVWTPERHFHDFGGLYPNPSVTSAALAMITKRVQIRSGSVVAPLHSPIRIAEEWSVVDNLSNGRVAVSFASGWMPEDFTVNPANYEDRKEIMLRDLEVVRRLWRGERVPLPGPLGQEVAVRIFPRPVQKQLPMWLTAAGNPETFQIAGKLGINLLTHLLGQNLQEVGQKIALYRQAWTAAGHAGRGRVTLMLHTFVGESLESVKAFVREPLIEYLRQSADLIKGYAWAFSAFKHHSTTREAADFSALPKPELDALLEHAFERYFESSGLFGTPASCLKTIAAVRAIEVDEVACLIDFGVNHQVVLDHLKYLDALRQAAGQSPAGDSADYSIPALIRRHYVTHLQCTPSMAGMLLLDERTHDAFGRLQSLLIGGEALPLALVKQLRKLVTGEIINMYGPTETTVWSSTCRVPSDSARIHVGHPIANTTMYVLDHNLSPVPVGVVGELLIGGDSVARGYLGRTGLTAERFIPDPFAANGSRRIYRTGDLARFLPDGNIEVLGRLDQQVKIRGHRVELGELEAVLNEHPAVRETVVIAKESAGGEKRLVAYVIPREGQNPARRELRQYAREKLPEFMVPAQIVFLSEFPQTPNRKIDRQALPEPEAGPEPVENTFEPPATEAEKAVAQLWSELLEIERIGRRDNFFECGGHSLLAMQLVVRIRGRFGVDLPLKNLFERPTIAGLAEAIEALSWSAAATAATARAGGGREEVVL